MAGVMLSNPNEVYIQAREGEHFAVRRKVLPDFDFMDVSHLKTNVTVGEHRGAFFDHSRKEIEAAGEAGHVNSHSSSIKYIDNKWMRCAFTFSALGLDEGLDTSEDCVSRGIEISGRITVSVQRGGAKSLPTPKLRSAAKWTSETSSTSSKDILKSGLVSHTTNLVPLKQIAPPPIAKAFEVASGSTGKRIAFIFRARSAACLRLLKIVDLDEDEAPTAQDASTNTMSSMPAGPVTKSPKTVFPAVKIEEAVTKKEELQDTRTLSIKRGHAVAFDEDDITIMSSRRAPNMQTSRQSVRNAASVRQSKLTEADRERKKAHLQLRRKEMDLERQELALRKRELAIEREELDLA
ncbi:hypothetical protein B0A48_14206 [Cryoendolithus antarcticus]|uniref:DUF7918 domain-containing protein n=1 Tax=Cryoendolithus antarcticus TaxID=1507870 RepID=A0A1V8SLI8_9PEZI|nr:hypothetical protein B0A48_14206 [Cryoendolithus antarcticus]